MVDEEVINELSQTYGIGASTIKKYCETLLTYPIVRSEDDSFLHECLEILVSDRANQSFSDDSKNDYLYTVEKCLYRIYGDDCIPYLSDNFKSKNGIEDD